MASPAEPNCAATCDPVGTIGWPADLTAATPPPHASAMVCGSAAHQAQAR